MDRPVARGNRGAARGSWLMGAALLVLALGIGLMLLAIYRQPPLARTAEVLPAPTVAVPAMPAGAALPGQGGAPALPGAMPQGVPQIPQGMPQAPQGVPQGLPGGMPAGLPGGVPPGMPPAGMMPVPAVPPTPLPPTATPTPPISDTIECQKDLRFKVEPEEAVITINGEVVGRAKSFKKKDELELPGPGVYYVKLSSPGYRSQWLKVRAHDGAEKETGKIEVKLSKDDDD